MQAFDVFINIPFVVKPAQGIDSGVLSGVNPAIKRAYVDAVLCDIESFAEESAVWEIRSLTLGGGTVSSFSPEDFRRLMLGLKRLLPLAPTTPVFATADPGGLTVGHTNELRACGVPQVMMRYFTADVREAAVLGVRSPEAEMGKTDILLEQANITRLGMKVVVGIAGQTPETLLRTLRLANRAGVERFELICVGQERDAELFDRATTWLAEHGFDRVTTYDFVKPGGENPLIVNWYHAATGDEPVCGRLAFGCATLSVDEEMMWSTIGDVDTYIRHPGEYEVITESVLELTESVRQKQRELDRVYRGGADGLFA